MSGSTRYRNRIDAVCIQKLLRQICRHVKSDIYAYFIDYAKAFERCQHQKIITSLRKVGVDYRDIRIFTNLFWNQRA